MSSVAARFFGPQVSRNWRHADVDGQHAVFRIDHDESFNQTTHLQYQPKKNRPWFGFNWRYDSGLVAGPVPCAGGNCNNGPNGTDTIVDASVLTPDQQFQAGLYCGGVLRDADHADQPEQHLPGFAIRLEYLVRFRRPARKTTTTIRPASHRAIFSTSPWDRTTSFTATGSN